MNTLIPLANHIAVILLVVVLVACFGGGSSDGNSGGLGGASVTASVISDSDFRYELSADGKG